MVAVDEDIPVSAVICLGYPLKVMFLHVFSPCDYLIDKWKGDHYIVLLNL